LGGFLLFWGARGVAVDILAALANVPAWGLMTQLRAFRQK
jgi:hypothetical protein